MPLGNVPCLLSSGVRSSIQSTPEGRQSQGSTKRPAEQTVNGFYYWRQRAWKSKTTASSVRCLEGLSRGWNRFVVAALRCHSPTNTYGSTRPHLLPAGAVHRRRVTANHYTG